MEIKGVAYRAAALVLGLAIGYAVLEKESIIRYRNICESAISANRIVDITKGTTRQTAIRPEIDQFYLQIKDGKYVISLGCLLVSRESKIERETQRVLEDMEGIRR